MTETDGKETKKAKKDVVKAPAVQKVYRDAINWLKDPQKPWPGVGAPFCLKCKLDQCGAKNPYMLPVGAENPTITFVYDAPSKKEDTAGRLTADGTGLFIKKLATDIAKLSGLDPNTFRYVAATRCAVVTGKGKAETGQKHCRHYVLDDLRTHRPQIIVPIGSAVLGLFSHKSNAQDWGGKILTFRGWFDDWLTDPKFNDGHPVYGPRPTVSDRILMVPLQKPTMVYASRNPRVIARWKGHLKMAMDLIKQGPAPLVYDRPWWRITDKPEEVEEALNEIKSNPGSIVTFDTETTGLRPFLSDKIVFMMIRWNSPDGTPKALGWPWDYRSSDKPKTADPDVVFEESPMLPHIERLTPLVLEALACSKLRGHNLTFDLLFVIGTLKNGKQYLDRLCEAWHEDTWHMRYALKQERGSIGLEIVAYDWAKDFAGYEEEFSLLIEQYPEKLHPKEGGHYANCPKDKWNETFRPYVMGDVEVCHIAAESIGAALEKTQRHAFPLAHPETRGRFRKYEPPNRAFVYRKLIGPAGSLLAKLMARGMYLDEKEVANQEILYPKMIFEARDKLRKSVPALSAWCDLQEAADPTWEFDLQDQKILKEALFGVLKIPVASITDAGLKYYGSLEKATEEGKIQFASTDKFALNHMAVNHPEVRELLKYRSLHKQYTSYVRPLRNITTKGIDKNERKGSRLLMYDSCVHAQFKIAGTRGGRLACSEPNLQQLPREGPIKKQFVSRFGKRGCIYQADLSQIELRLLAAACGDPMMVKAYHDGIDLHSLTTSLVFNVPYEHFGEEYEIWLQKNGKADEAKKLKGIRKIGKTLNFLTGYGGGAYGFQSALALQGIYIQLDEAERHIQSFFEKYGCMKKHIAYYKQFILDNGRAVSITGRVRIFDEVYSDDFGQVARATRAGYNHLIQATASDMMLISMGAIEHLMRDANMESMLVSTVHDSLAIDAVQAEVPAIHEIVNYVLSNIPEVMRLTLGDEYDISWAIVPFAGDASLGKSYGDEMKIPAKTNIDWDEIFVRAGLK